MASVRKRTETGKDGKPRIAWLVDYKDLSGKRRAKQFEKKRDAEGYLQQVQREIGDRTHFAQEQKVKCSAVLDWSEAEIQRRHKVGDSMTGHSRDQYLDCIRVHLRPHFGGRFVDEITSIDVQDFVNGKSVRYRRATVSVMVKVVRFMFGIAADRNAIVLNPLLKKTIRVSGLRARERRIPTRDEIRRLFEYVAQRQRNAHDRTHINALLAVTLGVLGGLRSGEICALRWSDIRFESSFINVSKSVSEIDGVKSPKTESSIRLVPMSPMVGDILHRVWIEQGRPVDGALLNPRGKVELYTPTSLYQLMKQIYRRAGLTLVDAHGVVRPKYNVHTLRHAAVSLLAAQRLPIAAASRIVGHSNPQTTLSIYTHLFAEDDTGRAALASAGEEFRTDRLLSGPVIDATPVQPR